MAYPITEKFVIAVSASALFDTELDEKVFTTKGIDAYKQYQLDNANVIYEKGIAFSFIQKFLNLNNILENNPVEVVLFTRNSPDLGVRLMESIKHYELNISRTCFSSGEYNYQYLPSFNACLFLSANEKHTRAAMKAGFAAGTVFKSHITDEFQEDNDCELRFAFDFDGVIADDASEKRHKENNGQLDIYFDNENNEARIPLQGGPLQNLIVHIARLQNLENEKFKSDPNYQKVIKTAIVTARNAPADERVITTLKDFNVSVDMAFFLGGIEKSRVLNVMRPHIYFDDDKRNLKNLENVIAVHIPFGVLNDETPLNEDKSGI